MAGRPDGRQSLDLRPIRIEPGVLRHAEGSVLVSFGDTRVICAASVEDKVPPFLKGSGQGWVTAEYGMLPRATSTRTARETGKGPSGRTHEIQRLIGRSLRAVTNLAALKDRTVWIDCDVLQADGGTRTAAISGAYVALVLALEWLRKRGLFETLPVTDHVAAVSVGISGGQILLDLCYEEDLHAAVDMNVVMGGAGSFIEIQGTGEEATFSRAELDGMLEAAAAGIQRIVGVQREVLAPVLRL